ncbi:MAG: hypothetical protein WCE23_15940 [Candidatus Binatus sp.]
MDSGSLNSERGLVERIVSGAPYHRHRLHRRMIGTALGAVFLAQFSARIREMRILGSHPMVRSQLAKRMVLAAKVVGFETFGCSNSHKEKKPYGDTLNLLRFFTARCLLQSILR